MKLKYTTQYKKDIKKLNPDNNLKKIIDEVVDKIRNKETLDPKYKNHKLKGNMNNFMELHLKPDLLLIYKIDDVNDVLKLIEIGSHSELFKK